MVRCALFLALAAWCLIECGIISQSFVGWRRTAEPKRAPCSASYTSTGRLTYTPSKTPGVKEEGDLLKELQIAAKVGNLARAETLMKQGIAYGTVDRRHYTAVISAAGNAGRLDDAERWFKKAQSAGCRPGEAAYIAVFAACSDKGHLERAEAWFRHMEAKGIDATRESYHHMMGVAAGSKTPEAAETWMQNMMDAGIAPNAESYSILLAIAAERADMAMCEDIFTRLIGSGIRPSDDFFSIVLGAAADAEDVDAINYWREEARSAGVTLSVGAHARLIGACAKWDRPDIVESLMAEMREAGYPIQLWMYNELIASCQHVADAAGAERAFMYLLQQGLRPNHVTLSNLKGALSPKAWQRLGEKFVIKRVEEEEDE